MAKTPLVALTGKASARMEEEIAHETPLTLKFLHCGNVSMSDEKDAEQKNIFYIPMGVFSLANEARREGADVEIVHSDLQAGLPIAAALDLQNIDAIGFDLHWANQSLVVLETAKAIKAIAPHVFTFTGGFTASYFSTEIVRDFPQIDAVCRGDSERPVRQLVAALREAKRRGRQTDRPVLDELLDQVQNLTWRRADGQVTAKPIQYVVTKQDLESFNFTSFSLMRDWELYKSLSRFWTHYDELATPPLFFMQPARGCRYTCKFCGGNAVAQSLMNGRKGLAFRSAESCLDTIKQALAAGYGTIYTSIEDVDSDDWYIDLLDQCQKEQLELNYVYGSWRCPSEELIDKLSETCEHALIEISPESAVEEIRLLNRDKRLFFTNAELEERLEHIAKKKNVRVQLYFGFYQVGETVETVDETIQFILRCVRRFPGFLELAYGAYSTDPGSLLQSDPDRYGVTMAPRHLKDYVTSLRRSFIEEKSLDTEMTLFRPAGISEEDDRAVRRRVLLLRSLFSGFRKTTSHLLARPGGEALILQILSRSEVPLTGKEVIAPATLLRLIAGVVQEGGELDELFLRILSLDYQELLSRPATLSPTSFFFRDDEIGGAAAIHPDVERYKAFLDTRGAAQIGTAAPSWYRVAEAFGQAERYWAEKAAAAAEAPTIDLADTSPPLVLPYLGDEPFAVLAVAAWQVLAARYTRTPSAPALLAAGARRPFLIHTWQNPDAPVRELLAAVAAEVREAAAQAFYLEQPALPPQIEQALSRPGTLVLTTAGPTGADLPPGKSERLAAWLLQGMAWLAGHPDAPLREMSFVPPGEHRTIVSTFNQTHREVPRGSLLHHFEAAVQKHGNRPAVRFRSAAMTYRQLDGRANQIARILLDCGLPGSRRVGVMLPTSDGLVSTLLGVLKTGSAFVPVDAGAPPVRRAAQLRDVGVDLVVTTPALAPAVAPQLPGVRICAIDSAATFPASAPEGARLTEPAAESPAYVIFTSGSTGRPKGVEVTHGNLVNFCLWRIAEYGLTEADVTYSVLPYYFDGFLSTLFPTLLAGGCLVLAPDESRRDVSHLKETLAGGVTNTALVPTIFEPLLAACTPEDVASLRWVVVGGEKLSAGRLAALRARFPGVRFINEYGPTETTVACLANPALDSARPANVGRPIANTRVYILDPHLNLVPLGFPGEICVAGHGVANGYVGPAAGEASGFVAHPHEPGRRMYRTGDLGFWHADGTVDLLGRVDTQLKIRGHRIELGEIEEALCQHEDILDAVVVPVDSQGRTAELCGFFVARAPVGEQALAEHLSARLPSFMIPQQLLAVAAIPLTATGKKDRRALRERVPRAAGEGVQADPEIAETVRSAIAGVLRIDARMDGSASFLQLGGDSIHMIILQRGLARELGVEIPLLDLLSARSIRSLIETVAKAVDARQIPHGPERFVRLSGKDGERSFFFLHDVSGEVAVYDALSRSLPAGFEYWGVRAHGLVKLAPARRRLQHLAQEYLHEILSRNKSDVFFLGGWSLGGVIAYEIARQLERLGKTVGALVLIDAPSPGTGELERPGADVAQERAWVERSFRGEAVRALAEPIETRTVEEYWTLFAARLDQANVPDTALLAAMPEEIAKIIAKYPQHGSAALLHQMNTVRTIVGAWAAYDPAAMGKIAADLTFVRPSESDPRAAELWARQTTGACEVAAVRGDHWSIFLRENMDELAAVLSATLEAGLRQHKVGSDGERLVGELAANLLKFEESPDSLDLNAEHWRELSRAKPGGAARSTPYGPHEARPERFGQAPPDSLRKIQTVP